MATRAIPARWSAILEPWRGHFKQMDDIVMRPLSNGQYEWVRVDLGLVSTRRSWRDNVQRCREALELLAVVVIAESALGGRMPQSLCGSTTPSTPDHTLPCRVLLNFRNETCISNVDDVDVYKAFFFAFDENSLRDEFRRAMDAIHSQLTPAMRQMVEKHWRLPVEFFLSSGRRGNDLSVAYLTSAVELARGIVDRANHATDQGEAAAAHEDAAVQRYRFPYSDLHTRLYFSSFSLEFGAAPVLAKLLALGVRANNEIDVSTNKALGRLPISELGPILQAITDRSSPRAEGFEKILSDDWKELEIQHLEPTEGWHARQLEAVCSSLVICRDFQQLHLSHLGGMGSSCECSQKVLQWLVYALFSKESQSSITTLTISYADLRDADMIHINNVLMATNPAKALLDAPDEGESGDDEDSGFASLKAGTTVTIKPSEDVDNQLGSGPESIVLKHDGLFRVMRNGRNLDWVDIIVPHYGYCIVRRDSVESFVPLAPSKEPSQLIRYRGKIVTLNVRESNHKTLLPLIDFIGPKLLSVDILVKYDSIIKISFLRRLVAGCPNLKVLKLGETEKGILTVLLDAYGRGSCHIEHLSFYNFLTGHGDSLIPFIRMLQDPASAAAKSLRFLKIPSAGHDLYKGSVFTALAEMLHVNRTIEYLEIDMHETLFEEHQAALTRANGRRVRRPLSLASRFAFLSVVQHFAPSSSMEPPRKRARLTDQTETHDAEHGRLGRAVVSSIFAFAAKSVARHIYIVPFYIGQSPPER